MAACNCDELHPLDRPCNWCEKYRELEAKVESLWQLATRDKKPKQTP